MARNPSQKTSLDELRELAEFMQEYDLTEVTVEDSKDMRRIRLRRGGSMVGESRGLLPELPGQAATSGTEDAPGSETELISAPIVGTFYRSPRPGDPPFVEEGDRVQVGDVLCIIEAMKLMNHIEAEFDAEIIEALVENATPVEYGQPLFRVRRV